MLRGKSRRLVVVAGLILLSLAVYWLASPLFLNSAVSEGLPSQNGSNLSTVAAGTFVDADGYHKTSGTATILQTANGSRFVRLADFRTTNGPDLFVVLASDRGGKDLTYLGPLKGNIGDQNYLVPSDLDLSSQKYVLIWCRTFSVLFGSAELSTS